MICGWLDEYFELHEKYPSRNAGEIPNSGGETWNQVHASIYCKGRGLPRKMTLPEFIAEHREEKQKIQSST
jgi:hypothetical protein